MQNYTICVKRPETPKLKLNACHRLNALYNYGGKMNKLKLFAIIGLNCLAAFPAFADSCEHSGQNTIGCQFVSEYKYISTQSKISPEHDSASLEAVSQFIDRIGGFQKGYVLSENQQLKIKTGHYETSTAEFSNETNGKNSVSPSKIIDLNLQSEELKSKVIDSYQNQKPLAVKFKKVGSFTYTGLIVKNELLGCDKELKVHLLPVSINGMALQNISQDSTADATAFIKRMSIKDCLMELFQNQE
jgi:hypothetical protein